MKLTELKPLENNPFKSRGDEQIKLISKSIEDFQKMLSIRKIVIDENNEILGGNKRYFALKMLGYKDVPDEWIDKRTDLTEEEKKRFIVTDNAHYGSTWDNEMLKEWGATAEWGVEIPEWAVEPDYSILDDEDVSHQLNEMTAGVKKAIQIEFEAEHYEEAYQLVKFWREQGDVGYMILQYLKAEKEKL